jgi:hypothetical protein
MNGLCAALTVGESAESHPVVAMKSGFAQASETAVGRVREKVVGHGAAVPGRQ